MHTTGWLEVSYFFWVCHGCSKQCQVFRTKPLDGLQCDSTDQVIHQVITQREVKYEKGPTS